VEVISTGLTSQPLADCVRSMRKNRPARASYFTTGTMSALPSEGCVEKPKTDILSSPLWGCLASPALLPAMGEAQTPHISKAACRACGGDQ
jgi:hypothetical protein